MGKAPMRTFRADDELWALITQAAIDAGVTRSEWIRRAAAAMLNRL